VRLGSAAYPELLARDRLHLLIPLGATEQHGPHLPLETDTLIARAVGEAVAAARSDVLLAPALPYGSSGEHADFPGTLSIGQAALETVVVELVRSAGGFRDVTLLAWHGGNTEPLARAMATLRSEQRAVNLWQPHVEGGDAHAGWVETSLMLALAQHLVGSERPVGVTEPLDALLPRLRRDGVKAVSANGVLGDARGASARTGQRLLEGLAADVSALLDARSNGAPRT
jgi:mycofactocin precursor peptide peptidase